MDLTTYASYTELRQAAGIVSDYAVSRDTKVPQYKISRWKRKGLTPKYPDLKKIADYIGCTVDDFYRDETI